jgi:hypothetical protein
MTMNVYTALKQATNYWNKLFYKTIIIIKKTLNPKNANKIQGYKIREMRTVLKINATTFYIETGICPRDLDSYENGRKAIPRIVYSKLNRYLEKKLHDRNHTNP